MHEIIAAIMEGVADDPGFRAWFKGSKVVKGGRPLVMYHGTGHDFDEFAPHSHFGTSRAANHRLGHRKPATGAHIRPVYLSIKNPLRVDDAEASEESSLLRSIVSGTYPDLDPGLARREGAYAAAAAAGYDGLVYNNRMEDRGKLSWVIFDPKQVRSAITGQ